MVHLFQRCVFWLQFASEHKTRLRILMWRIEVYCNFITYQMLPKLQQSSLATSLRRDNLASQIQCIAYSIQVRISSRAFWTSKTIKHTNPGKINTPPKILTVLLEISPKSIFLNKESRKFNMNPSMNIHYQDPSPNIPGLMETEVEALAPLLRNKSIKNQPLNLELSWGDKYQLLSSEGTTIAATSLSE